MKTKYNLTTGFLIVFIVFVSLILFDTYNRDRSRDPWDGSIQWFYDNLDDEDRLKIRQAMDYAIPRQKIIDEILFGLALPIASPIGKNLEEFWDSTLEPRDYNLSKSLELLTEVFGKKYHRSYNSDIYTNESYFHMTLVSPTTSIAQTQMAQLITQSFEEIGIDVELKWWNWNIIIPRIYLDPEGVGYDYTHGGVDGWFNERNFDNCPDFSTEFFPHHFAPKGNNAQWINNPYLTEMINISITDRDFSSRFIALNDFQSWYKEMVPNSVICQNMDILAFTKGLKGLDNYLLGKSWCFNNITIPNKNSITYIIPGEFIDLNPLSSSNFYDSLVISNIFGSLASIRGNYNLTHPIPQLAENWTVSQDELEWIVNLRRGIKWHDGTELTADDVIFTYHSILNESLFSPKQSFFWDRFPNNESDITKLDEYSVKFNLGSYYSYVPSRIFNLPIIQKSQWESIPLVDWKPDFWHYDSRTEYPIGCGPYKISNIGTNSNHIQNITLEKNNFYDESIFGHNPEAEGGGIWFTDPTLEKIDIIIVREDGIRQTPISGLEQGIYDIIDPHYKLNDRLIMLNDSENDWAEYDLFLEYGWQELTYNQYDPRWGMNPHNPKQLYQSDYGYDYGDINRFYFTLFILIPVWIVTVTIGIALAIYYIKFKK